MILVLPFPHKLLWPNGSVGSHRARSGQTKVHKAWAHTAVLASKARPVGDGLRLNVTVHPKRFGPAPDKDNCAAACKAYQDGIAAALGVDDRHFGEPTIMIAERSAHGAFVVEVTPL